MIEICCIVSGEVQNVAYRAYVQEAAGALTLTGWVKNLSSGEVEVVAQGTPDVLKEFVEYLHEGSLMAKVDAVSIDWKTAHKQFEDFIIKHK